MENIFEEKVIELKDNTKYCVIKQTIYNDKIYLLANELVDDETPSDTLAILRVDTTEDKMLFTLEGNQTIVNELLNIFAELLK